MMGEPALKVAGFPLLAGKGVAQSLTMIKR